MLVRTRGSDLFKSGPLSHKAIVIGAGVAGLAAARALGAGGWSVTILEARDRAGGRVLTDRSNPDLPLDLGPSWVHGTHENPIARVLEESGARFETTDWDSYALWIDGKPQDDCEWAFEVFDYLEARKERIERDETVDAAMQRFFAKRNYSALERKTVEQIAYCEIVTEFGADLDRHVACLLRRGRGAGGRRCLRARRVRPADSGSGARPRHSVRRRSVGGA